MNAPVRSAGGGRKSNNLAVGDTSIKRATPPEDLLDENAQNCWKMNAKLLIERGSYAQEDALLLLAYCNAFSMMLRCDKELAGGFTVDSAMGGLKKHPLVNVRNDAVSQMTRLGSLLGLNPMSRVRFLQGGGDDNEPGNEFDDF